MTSCCDRDWLVAVRWRLRASGWWPRVATIGEVTDRLQKSRPYGKEAVMPMSVPVKRAALYARVSSEKQAECHTIDSQIDAIQARIKTDGLTCEAGLSFCDDGFSGEILERPALERLRDQVAAGA